jgi:voltage-gated potassium channel
MQGSDTSPGVPPAAQAGPRLIDQAGARPPSRRVAWTIGRVTISVAGLVTLYYLLPLPDYSSPAAITILVAGLAGFIVLVGFQARSIARSPFPGLRVAEALATGVPFFLLLFAATYVVLAAISVDNFGEPLSHTDGLYFAVTVFTTAGFGDITARSAEARLVVTGQMITDVIVLGAAIRILLGAGRRRWADRKS